MWELCLGFGRAACLVLELDGEGVQVERSIQGEMCYSDSARYNCLQVEVEVLLPKSKHTPYSTRNLKAGFIEASPPLLLCLVTVYRCVQCKHHCF